MIKIVSSKNYWYLLAVFFTIFVTSFILPESAHAQFSGNLATIKGSMKWGDTVPTVNSRVVIEGQTTGFHTEPSTGQNGSYSTGPSLPADTYTVTAYTTLVRGNGSGNFSHQSIEVGTPQTITVEAGQEVAGVNFDIASVTGLVKGNLKINGVAAGGIYEFCGPLETDPCLVDNPWLTHNVTYTFNPEGFRIPMLPGDYRLRVISGVDMGILPVTVVSGQLIDLTTSSVAITIGQNTSVSLAGVTVTFSEVTTSGFMNILTTSHPQGGLPPSQYRFLGTYYELNTTATYTGTINISFHYNDADVHGHEDNLKLFHWDGANWANITTSVDTVNNIITGQTTTLSPFAIGEPLHSPTVDAGGPYQIDEGGSIQLQAVGTDGEDGTVDYSWDLDNNGSFETTGQEVNFSAVGLDGPTSRNVVVQVKDHNDLVATDQATVEVSNVAPKLQPITAPSDPMAINAAINTSVEFTDPGTVDTYSAVWNWGDNTTSNSSVSNGTVTGSHTYSTAGVYTVKIIVSDDDGGSDEQVFQYVVIYDPDGGFVTGGGEIDSPIGAYIQDPALTGKANFGFVSKYQQGATVPTGQTNFQFKVAMLNFQSTDYEWLVIAGSQAKYKGTGTINGNGNFGFLLAGIDGDIKGNGETDKFRIKIWDKDNGDTVVYDNQLGADDNANLSTTITRGNIVIHKL